MVSIDNTQFSSQSGIFRSKSFLICPSALYHRLADCYQFSDEVIDHPFEVKNLGLEAQLKLLGRKVSTNRRINGGLSQKTQKGLIVYPVILSSNSMNELNEFRNYF